MQDDDKTTFKQQLDAGAAMANLRVIDSDLMAIPAVLVPDGYKLHTLEKLMESYQLAPPHLKQRVVMRDPKSFCEYIRRHGTESTAIFCDMDAHTFTAILDYHQGDNQKHGFHHAILKLEQTPELKKWSEHDGKQMDQTDFAAFIESNSPEIIRAEQENGTYTPSGAEMLQIALTLSRTETAAFRSATRLSNGQTQFKYEQNFDDRAGEMGELTIPDTMRIGLPVFKGGEASEGYAVNARFRYRIRSGKLTMWYELVRPERIIEDAVKTVYNQISGGLADLTCVAMYHGRTA